MLSVIWTTKFKKDYQNALKSGLDISHLDEVISILAKQEKLPLKYKNHKLKGKYSNSYECHIESDWLLIYKINNERLMLILFRTGSHSQLF